MTQKTYPIEFTGGAWEYFKIYMVNMVFTVLTLGIYSAWAKVRTERWFHGHTRLDGQPFAYHATPMQIFKGRMLVVALMLVYVLLDNFVPFLSVILLLLVFVATPWLMLSSLRFNAAMTSYRGLRFSFKGTLEEAFIIYLVLPIAIPFTLGLILPYLTYRQVRFVASNMAYGNVQATYDGNAKSFVGIYLKVMAIFVVPLGLLALCAYLLSENTAFVAVAAGLGVAVFYAAMLVSSAYIASAVRNLKFNNASFGPVRFQSTQNALTLIGLYITNALAVGISLGLLYPWAKVRLTRYKAATLVVESAQDLGMFTGELVRTHGATGDELADALDVDVSLV
jgi:uncharacterized membrane protein YjgN (DUF898 family)